MSFRKQKCSLLSSGLVCHGEYRIHEYLVFLELWTFYLWSHYWTLETGMFNIICLCFSFLLLHLFSATHYFNRLYATCIPCDLLLLFSLHLSIKKHVHRKYMNYQYSPFYHVFLVCPFPSFFSQVLKDKTKVRC